MSTNRETRRKTMETEGTAIIAAITVAMWAITIAGLGATLPEWWTGRSDPLDNCAWSMVALCDLFTALATWGLDTLLAVHWPRRRSWRIVPPAITTALVIALATVGAPTGTRGGHLAFDAVAAVTIIAFMVTLRWTWRSRIGLPRAATRTRRVR